MIDVLKRWRASRVLRRLHRANKVALLTYERDEERRLRRESEKATAYWYGRAQVLKGQLAARDAAAVRKRGRAS